MESLSLSGLSSGFDWKSVVNQLVQLDRAPQTRLRAAQSSLLTRADALSTLTAQLQKLKSKAAALADVSTFQGSRLAKSSDSSFATASADATAATGVHSFKFFQLATASVQKGAANISLAAAADEALTSRAAGFAIGVTAGNFSINGKTISVGAEDTLNTVLDRINNSGAGVAASYDSAADRVTLSSGSAIVLGSATDTSNFLQAARLAANGTGTIASQARLGAIQTSDALSSARLRTPVESAGQFAINGVTIDWSSSDTLDAVIARINQSGAGVTAAYDRTSDRVTLTNKQTGNVGISLADISGNFLDATGLAGGSLTTGGDLLFSVNDSGVLSNRTNTINSETSGVAGVTIQALKAAEDGTAAVTVSVEEDHSAVRKAITEFIDEYNKTQALLDVQTASSTDVRGKVTAGVLSDDRDAAEISQNLRSRLFSDVAGLSGALERLGKLGFGSDGYSNQAALSDAGALDRALSASLTGVKELFADPADGIARRLDQYLNSLVGDEGSLVRHRQTYLNQSTRMDEQVSDMEKRVQTNRQRLIDSFVTMEKVLAQINQQSSFFAQRFQ